MTPRKFFRRIGPFVFYLWDSPSFFWGAGLETHALDPRVGEWSTGSSSTAEFVEYPHQATPQGQE